MAISVRKNSEEMYLALAYALNAMQGQVQTAGYHRDLTEITNSPIFTQSGIVLTQVTVSAPSATDLASALVLANQELAVLHMHLMDDQAHLIKDFVNDPYADGYAAPATNLAELEVLLNALKLLFVAHCTQSGVHVNNDTTNYGLPTNATNLGNAKILANALATAMNTHMGNAGTSLNCPRIHIMDD
jgi:hypothetical protein